MSETTPAISLLDALRAMIRGDTLLKAGRAGKPHFRHFQLSPDLLKLQWESPKKNLGESSVLVSEITELVKGQQTKVFQNNRMPEYEERSFSLLHQGRSLDIICKDKREYEVWTTGMQALIKGEITKLDLSELNLANLDNEQKLQVVIDRGATKVLIREDACDVYTWGDGTRGKLGHGEEDGEPMPKVVEALLGHDIKILALGSGHSMALGVSGDVFSWGSGVGGRLGHGRERDRFTPLRIANLRGFDVIHISCHDFHAVAVCDNGELYTWGRGDDGRLGFDAAKQTAPAQVVALEGKRAVHAACGSNFTLAVIDNGDVYGFGNNDKGQLGNGERVSQVEPCLVNRIAEKVVKVACGNAHACALTETGRLWSWGANGFGQLGLGNFEDRLSPCRVEAIGQKDEVVDVACGAQHTLALTASGIIYAFGDGATGQLGLGALQTKPVANPLPIPSFEGRRFTAIACGSEFSAGVSDSGKIYTWGNGASNCLGLGDTKTRYTPTLIESMADKRCRAVACSQSHMAATVLHGWVPDDEATQCMACKLKFTTIRRRHHCRKCGGVYCGSCSSKKFPLLEAGFSEAVRVCDKCFSILSK